jgi:hypothetical protein
MIDCVEKTEGVEPGRADIRVLFKNQAIGFVPFNFPNFRRFYNRLLRISSCTSDNSRPASPVTEVFSWARRIR